LANQTSSWGTTYQELNISGIITFTCRDSPSHAIVDKTDTKKALGTESKPSPFPIWTIWLLSHLLPIDQKAGYNRGNLLFFCFFLVNRAPKEQVLCINLVDELGERLDLQTGA